MNTDRYSGNKWYYKLVKGDHEPDPNRKVVALSEHYTATDLYNKFVIAFELTKGYAFRVYDSYIDFVLALRKQKPEECLFHETLYIDKRLKLYIDFDIAGNLLSGFDESRLFNYTVVCIVHLFRQDNIQLKLDRDFVWLTCHRNDKKSYHLIIDNYYFYNYRELNEFIKKLRTIMPADMHSWIDWGVYIPNKNFRTLGSVKMENTSNAFVFLEEWQYNNKTIKYKYADPDGSEHKIMLQYEASLITQVDHCSMIPTHIKYDRPDPGSIDLSQTKLDQSVLDQVYQSIPDFSDTYTLRSIMGNKILLNRIRPSYCPQCDKIHDNENPEVRVIDLTTDKSGSELKFLFYCRRSPKPSVLGFCNKTINDSDGKYEYVTKMEGNIKTFSSHPVRDKLVARELLESKKQALSVIDQGCSFAKTD